MSKRLIAVLSVVFGVVGCGKSEFAAPVRLKSGNTPIRVEAPGYACPAWADIDGDGKKDLLVGQFNGGKIRMFKNQGDNKLGDGAWVQADGKDAEVPGVW